MSACALCVTSCLDGMNKLALVTSVRSADVRTVSGPIPPPGAGDVSWNTVTSPDDTRYTVSGRRPRSLVLAVMSAVCAIDGAAAGQRRYGRPIVRNGAERRRRRRRRGSVGALLGYGRHRLALAPGRLTDGRPAAPLLYRFRGSSLSAYGWRGPLTRGAALAGPRLWM